MHICRIHLVVLVLLVASPVFAAQVTVQFTATVATTTDTPFGIAPALGTEVTGMFTYDTATQDGNADAQRGDYAHDSGGGFSATIQDHGLTIAGSATPWVQIEDLDSDTFRFVDGPRSLGPAGGIMSVNSVPDETVQLAITVTDASGAILSGDELPEVFPFVFPGPPHTFVLSDDQGTLLLQITDAVTPVTPVTWGSLKSIHRR